MRKLISDKYRKKRGGYARILDIACAKCDGLICRYQKDGPGHLKRIYIDRILEPIVVWSRDAKLTCGGCGKWVGIGDVYKIEKRNCFTLMQGAVKKKIIK